MSCVVTHYAVTTCPSSFSSAQLIVPMHSIDPDPPDPTVTVFVFRGDGTVSLDEWTAGSELIQVTGLSGEYPVATIDVSAELGNCIAASDPYISFRLECTGDGLDLAGPGGVEEPSLVVWP